jgi:hypothetical protein
MKNNYGTALCPEEASCTLTHTQLHSSQYPFSFHLLKNTQRKKMIIQDRTVKDDWPSLAHYM